MAMSLTNECNVGRPSSGDTASQTDAEETGSVSLCDDWWAVQRRQQKFWDLYLFALDGCLRGGAEQWWQRAFNYDETCHLAEGVEKLKDFCLHHLLYEAGDIWTFHRIYEILKEGGFLEGDDRGRFLHALTQYAVSTLANLGVKRSAQVPSAAVEGRFARYLARAARNIGGAINRLHEKPAFVSVILVDDRALVNFIDFCIPSLAGAGGLRSLNRRRAVRLHVFARERDLPRVKQALDERKLGCTIACDPIPEDLGAIAESVAGPQREWLIDALQCLQMMAAKRLRADFHSLNPNAVYATGFFEGISRLTRQGKRAILLATFYAQPDAIRSELESFQVDGRVVIQAADLTGLAARAVVPGSGVRMVRDFGYLGGLTSHLQAMWESETCVEIHSTQHEIAFLASDVLDKLPSRFFMKPSAEVDCMLGRGILPHFVDETDRIAMLDIGARKDTLDGRQVDFAKFGALVLRSTRESQAEYFKKPIRLSLSRAASPQPWRQQAEMVADRDALLRSLDKPRNFAAPTGSQALTALSILHQYEVSEYGLENMSGIVAEARRILDSTRNRDDKLDAPVRRDLARASLNFDHVGNAITLAKEGREGTAFLHDFLIEMMKLKQANKARAQQLRTGLGGRRRRFAVIGAIVWGAAFVDKFMDYCLPSLLAPGNIPALARGRKVVLSIVTTDTDRDRITAHPAFARVRNSAEVVFTCFPTEFLERREEDGLNFYYFYGLLDHQSVFLAQSLRADLYLLPIDCVYSSECLRNFSAYLDKEADCCSVAAIEADEPALRTWLDADNQRSKDVLELSAKELLQAAAQRPDRYFRSMIMNHDNVEFCAHPRELVWPFVNGLAIHSVFMHPLAVSARLLSRPFHPNHENVDYALLPRLLQNDGRIKIIEDASEAALAHFGAPVTRDEYLDGGFSIKTFIEAHRYDYAVHRRFFAARQFFPCQDPPYTPSTEHDVQLALIQSVLVRHRFKAE